jgi:hypothetical protein
MRRTLFISALLLIVIVSYSAWPFYGLFELVGAAKTGDEGSVSERVDFPALRQSLTEQMLSTYMRLTGTGGGSFLTQQLALTVAGSMADPLVAEMVTAKAIIELVRTGWPSAALGPPPAQFQQAINFDSSAWRLYANSEYGFNEFRLWVPADKPRTEQYRLVMQRQGTAWKLSGVRLPVAIQEDLARKLIKERAGPQNKAPASLTPG